MAACLNSDISQNLHTIDGKRAPSKREIDRAVYQELLKKDLKIKFLFLTPEKLSQSQKLNDAISDLYQKNKLSRFAIDEAHCISQWGHDFRPDYRKLKNLRLSYPEIPIIALTACATPLVKTDIIEQLGFKNYELLVTNFV